MGMKYCHEFKNVGPAATHPEVSPLGTEKPFFTVCIGFPRVETRGYKYLAPLGPRLAMFEDRALSIKILGRMVVRAGSGDPAYGFRC